MITVQSAGIEDIPALISLGCRMREESAIPFPPVDEKATREALIELGSGYHVSIAEQDGEPCGFIAGAVSRFVFSTDFYIVHDIFYVRPESRGSRAAFLLVNAFCDWGRGIGARHAMIGVHTGLRPEVTGRFYEKLGFRFIGGNYLKEF